LHGLGKIARDLGKRGHKKVSEAVSLQSIACAKAVREQLRQQILFFAEGHHAVAQVAGRKHVEVLPQPSR